MTSEGNAMLLEAINQYGSLSGILDASIRPRQRPLQRPGLKARIDQEDEPLLPESDYETELLFYLEIIIKATQGNESEGKDLILNQVHLRYKTPHHENRHVREVIVDDLRAVVSTLKHSRNFLNKFGKVIIDEERPTSTKPQSKRQSHVPSTATYANIIEDQDEIASLPNPRQGLKRAFHGDLGPGAPAVQEALLYTQRRRITRKTGGFIDLYGDTPSSESDTESEGPITAWKGDQEDSTAEWRNKQGLYHKELRFRRLEKELMASIQGLLSLYIDGQYVEVTEFPGEEKLWKKWQETDRKDKEGIKAANEAWTNHVQALDRAKTFLYLIRKERKVPIQPNVQQLFLQALYWKSLYDDRSNLLKDQKYVTALKKAHVSRRLYEAEHRPSKEDFNDLREDSAVDVLEHEDEGEDESVEEVEVLSECDDSDDEDFVPE
ncbi:uncharacterized protein K452DRAFT_345810 [Aplosporella prunicola CBS 121167]|uniref:Uncharacterized protein n=1 Tax=Aplosporella prunicola CBS 121167 TaxID=1176127 RepID=A0A6A6BJV9_9PEZI|nr:uncharacterized protein K452DRAFT_345810 [Aplosporella prunicola CBS 121167]KAF2144306.1 hypothetical protein K452DRAFT_345810 [Aplosporella prunicola CBS 121167]